MWVCNRNERGVHAADSLACTYLQAFLPEQLCELGPGLCQPGLAARRVHHEDQAVRPVGRVVPPDRAQRLLPAEVPDQQLRPPQVLRRPAGVAQWQRGRGGRDEKNATTTTNSRSRPRAALTSRPTFMPIVGTIFSGGKPGLSVRSSFDFSSTVVLPAPSSPTSSALNSG
eukprot:SAG22_NODE_5709_length_967_cov_1.175115_2_plen_169_part_01